MWNRARAGLLAILALAVSGLSPTWGQSAPATGRQARITLDKSVGGVRLIHPEDWSIVADGDGETTLLMKRPAGGMGSPEAASADRSFVSIERRLSPAEAVERLHQIAAETSPDIAVAYVDIGGWPALTRSYSEAIPKIGLEDRQHGVVPMLKRVTVAVAAGPFLVRLEGTLVSNSEVVAQEVLAIGRSMVFDRPGDAAATQATLERLRTTPRPEPSYKPAPGPRPTPAEGAAGLSFAPQEISDPGLVRDLGNFSEIEVAASTSGQDIIVATNSRAYSVSNDGGVTFVQRNVNPAYPANGDPSLGVGPSGAFYFGFIAYPDNTGGAGNNIQACTTGITASTDNGTTFTHRGHATICPFSGAGVCFPDQEHITADRFNPSATNQDMVYSAWRNFTPGGGTPNCNGIGSGSVQSQVRCSTDGGQNWGSTRNLAGDFPRLTTGADGFVYVVTRAFGGGGQINIYKYDSCGAGFNLQAGFPRAVTAGTNAVTCPMAGLDRCNDGNDLRSATVAVDDLDPSHIFVAYATNTAANNEDVVVQDSTDGGVNWSAAVQLNNGFAARRYMPWVCAVGGTAYVGWYDRRVATLIDNSLTDFYVGNATRDGGLAAGPELRVSPNSDSNCGSGWCTPRSSGDSESCTQQPQLAGSCGDGVAGTPDSGQACDYSDGGCPNPGPSGNPETCLTGGGCPKYGDYSGIACQAGRLYAAYASATPPGGPQSQNIRSFLLTKVVCCVPQVNIPGNLAFADTCTATSRVADLNVCNTGKEDLEVTSITSSSARYTVDTPTSGFPVMISPDFCFPFQVRFSPTAAGPVNATLTVANSDPVNPSAVVNVTGNGVQRDIDTLIADAGDFGDVCRDQFKDLPLTINNSGACDLSVTAIGSSAAEFDTPSVLTFPVIVGPGDSLEVPIRLAPTTIGAKAANITVSSNDPDTPARVVPVTGNTPPGDVRVTGSTDFGDVCAGTQAEKTLSVCNVGACNLAVTSVAFDPPCSDFTLINSPFPATVSPDSCEDVVIRFTPTSAGPKSCTLVIQTDDPDTPSISKTVTANTPLPEIDVPPDLGFPPTAIQSVGACTNANPFPVSNVGTCPLRISNFAISAGSPEFALSGLPSFPIILDPGHIAGEGDLDVVFGPAAIDRDRPGTVSVTYISEPITGATAVVNRNLCGEGVRTGARVLVTAGGVPMLEVEQIRLQRINANRNKNLLDTVDNARNLGLQPVVPGAPCAPFQYHREYGTVSNPIQLLPGSYQVTVTAIVSGKRTKKSVGFEVGTCGFNPNIVVNF